jgi:hypothetical protein
MGINLGTLATLHARPVSPAVVPNSPRSTILNIFCLHESSRIIDRKATVAQPAITRTMIVPQIVFTMLATG